MRLRNVWLIFFGLVLLTTGCSSDPGPPDPSTLPDGAMSLTQNQPNGSTIEGLTVVVGNIDENGAYLRGWSSSDDKPGGTGDRVDIGDTIDIEGTTLRLVATWVDPDPREVSGGSRSMAWVVVESDDIPSPSADEKGPEGE